MTELVSPFVDIRYGWSYGEDNWNLGMDSNLLTLSYLAVSTIKGFGPDLPSLANGDAYFNTSDSRVYYAVNNRVYSIQTPPNKSFYNTADQLVYVFDGYTLSAKSYISQDFADSRYVQQTAAGVLGLSLLATATAAAARSTMGLGTASTQATGFFEPAITAGTTSQYLRGDKSLATFDTSVRAATLTGLSVANSTAITAADTNLTAFGKLQAQVSLKATLASPAFTGVPTAPTASSGTSTTQIATTQFVTNAVTASNFSIAQIQAIALSF